MPTAFVQELSQVCPTILQIILYFMEKLQLTKPEAGEIASHFIVRVENYLNAWYVELSVPAKSTT